MIYRLIIICTFKLYKKIFNKNYLINYSNYCNIVKLFLIIHYHIIVISSHCILLKLGFYFCFYYNPHHSLYHYRPRHYRFHPPHHYYRSHPPHHHYRSHPSHHHYHSPFPCSYHPHSFPLHYHNHHHHFLLYLIPVSII